MASPNLPPYGVWTPMVTFFHADESIDVDACKSHIKRMAEGGVAGLVLQGSNGEAPHLDHAERQLVISTARSYLDELGYQGIRIIAGCSAPSVKETLVYIQEAKDAGADFGLVLPPSYWAAAMGVPVVEGFFSAVLDESPLPLLIYNFPGVASGIDISSDTVIRLAQKYPGKLVGCKLTCGNVGKLQRIWGSLPEGSFTAFAGKSDFMLPGLVAGSNGVIAALANVVPKTHVQLLKLWDEGKIQEARALQSKLSIADGALQKVGVAGVKAVVSHYFGYGSGNGRRPLKKATVEALSSDVVEHIQVVIDLEKQF